MTDIVFKDAIQNIIMHRTRPRRGERMMFSGEKLLDIIRDNIQNSPVKPVKTLVFVENKKTTDFIAYLLQSIESCVTSIHGDRL